jgi:hypothetical protein
MKQKPVEKPKTSAKAKPQHRPARLRHRGEIQRAYNQQLQAYVNYEREAFLKVLEL